MNTPYHRPRPRRTAVVSVTSGTEAAEVDWNTPSGSYFRYAVVVRVGDVDVALRVERPRPMARSARRRQILAADDSWLPRCAPWPLRRRIARRRALGKNATASTVPGSAAGSVRRTQKSSQFAHTEDEHVAEEVAGRVGAVGAAPAVLLREPAAMVVRDPRS